MKRQDIVELLALVPDDAEIQVVIALDSEPEDLEPGAVLDIVSAGTTQGLHVLYARPS